MSVLLLSDTGTRQALRNPLIAGRSRVGRGFYSVVFSDGADKVLRMTCDPLTYGLHCDGVMSLTGTHFATVTADHNEIGEQRSGEIPIFLFGTERLVKPLPGTPEKRLAAQIVKVAQDVAYQNTQRCRPASDSSLAVKLLERMAINDSLPFSIREALGDLVGYCSNVDGVALDFHSSNIMLRPGTDELVLNDPIHDHCLLVARDMTLRSGFPTHRSMAA